VTTYAHQYPTTAHVAKQCLSFPATAAQSEFDYWFLTGSKNRLSVVEQNRFLLP